MLHICAAEVAIPLDIIFRKCVSTGMFPDSWKYANVQPTSMTSDIYESFEKYDETRALFLDISKALGKVWHNGIIFKLKCNGISGNLLRFLENYRRDRFQRVVLNGTTSNWRGLNAGVPQGSVLGPLLFLIYINALTDNISSQMRLFADDSSLFYPC